MGIFSSLTGTLVNTGTVLVGSLLGLCIGRALPQRLGQVLMKALGLCTILIGVQNIVGGKNTLVTIMSMVIGTAIGELLNLDKLVNGLGSVLEKKLGHGSGTIAEGFVTSSLVFCVGAMTVVGCLNSGLTGDHTILYTKACLDLISSLIFATTMGFGVVLSAGFVLVLQGSLTLLANLLAPYLSAGVVTEMTAVGGLLIIGLGLDLLGVVRLKIMNFLPALFLPILLCPLYDWAAGWLGTIL